jgi:hypothetical protein
MSKNLSFAITPSGDGLFTFEKTRESHSILQGWVKIIPDDCILPLPSAVQYPNQIPGRMLFADRYEPDPNEIIVEGYLFDRFKTKKGFTVQPWNYRISGINSLGRFFSVQSHWIDIKKQMREQGMEKTLLAGKNTLAALVRIAHANRLGMIFEY